MPCRSARGKRRLLYSSGFSIAAWISAVGCASTSQWLSPLVRRLDSTAIQGLYIVVARILQGVLGLSLSHDAIHP